MTAFRGVGFGGVGPAGPAGAAGAAGAAGQGVPTGGTTNQVLSKIDNTNYNTQWVTPAAGGALTVVSKTSNYTIANTDGVILVDGSGGAFNLTLPTSPAAGQVHFIERTDLTLANAVSLVGTIEGDTDYTVNTPGEVYQILYTGSVWKILFHKTKYLFASTTTQITASTSGPTKGNLDNGADVQIGHRDGKFFNVHLELHRGTAASGGDGGAGVYAFNMPSGLIIDTVQLPVAIRNWGYNTTVGTMQINNTGGGSTVLLGTPYVLNTTQIRFAIQNTINGFAVWQAGSFGDVWTGTETGFAIDMRIPVLGWKD